MHKTKIITTLGPATDSISQLTKLHSAGSSIARLNFSHGDDSWFTETIKNVEAVSAKHQRAFSIMVDTKGPEIRTRDTAEPVVIEEGKEYTIACDPASKADIHADYPYLTRDIPVGQLVLIDGGTLTMHVTGHKEDMLVVRAEQSGVITSRRHFNVPGIHLDLPVLDSNDERRLKLTLEHADMLALSFINKPEDLEKVRAFIATVTDRYIPLIPKIETQMGLDRIEDIVQASDGIMIARGDLGVEIPMELLPTAQRHILAICHKYSKPCIVATHMMKSMTDNPTPTRAEILDVGHAVYDGTDVIMTSEETSVGKFPIETIQLMSRIAAATETSMLKQPVWSAPTLHPSTPEFLKKAIKELEKHQGNVLVYDAPDRETIRLVAALRLPVCCIAVCADKDVARYTALNYGQYGCLSHDKAEALAKELLGADSKLRIVEARG